MKKSKKFGPKPKKVLSKGLKKIAKAKALEKKLKKIAKKIEKMKEHKNTTSQHQVTFMKTYKGTRSNLIHFSVLEKL